MTSSPTKASAADAASEHVYDVIGVGYGPAHLALSIALREEAEKQNAQLANSVWLEKSPAFAWHTSLLLPGAQLQVSPFKDMATMRNPCSSFTFVNYLFTNGRLASSINKDSNIPSRREWSAYLTWCAERMQRECPGVVRYGSEVTSIQVVDEDEARAPRLYRVAFRDTSTDTVRSLLARNLSIAIGGMASIPQVFSDIYHSQAQSAQQPARLIHSSHYLPSLAQLKPALDAAPASEPTTLAVIGSGQSAAEMCAHLHRTFPLARIELIFRGPALRPSDDSSFVNAAAFDPEATDAFWRADIVTRRKWRADFERTNYAVVRSNVLNELYEIGYEDRIELPAPYANAAGPSEGTVRFRPNTHVRNVEQADTDGKITLQLDTVGQRGLQSSQYDAVFLGTGFDRRLCALPSAKPLAQHYPAVLGLDEAERIAAGELDEPDLDLDDEHVAEEKRERNRGVTRDYRLVSTYASKQRATAISSPSSSGSASPSQRGRSISTAASRRNSELSSGSSRSSSATSSATLADGALQEDEQQQQQQEGAVYVLGCNEPTHGLSDSLLSVAAFRAGEVAASLIPRMVAQGLNWRLPASTTAATSTTQEADAQTSNLSRDDSKAHQTLSQRISGLFKGVPTTEPEAVTPAVAA